VLLLPAAPPSKHLLLRCACADAVALVFAGMRCAVDALFSIVNGVCWVFVPSPAAPPARALLQHARHAFCTWPASCLPALYLACNTFPFCAAGFAMVVESVV